MSGFSAPFIARPIGTTLLTLAVLLAGAVAFFLLPISSLPQVDIPTIAVSASLPGASPEVVASTVATPLERHLGEIADVSEMTSRSTVGQTQIVLQFGVHRDLDGAARDVQAAIESARADLPSSLRSNPNYRKFNPANAPIMVLTLVSRTRTQGQLYDLASNSLQPALSQIGGVGNVGLSGSSLPAIRVELNPRVMFKYGIGLEDVRAALAAGNANTPKGAIEVGDRRYQIYANDVLSSDVDRGAALYGGLIVAQRNGGTVRLSDVAEVEGSVEDVRNAAYCDGEPCVVLQVSQQPGANIIATVDRIEGLLPRLSANLPTDVELRIRSDQTQTIRASLRDTGWTLAISIILVIGVVYLFLRDWRATVIPSVAVPVSLVGTFGAMYLMGFTLDNLSLMALTVATGFVVDDAIVVMENIMRHIEGGMSRMEAALVGAKEVGFTVLSMTLSLCAVFLPIPLMGGTVGQLFSEFVTTLSVAIGISLVVSLTTTPMLCALLLRPHSSAPQSAFKRWLDRRFEDLLRSYTRSLDVALDNKAMVMIILAITVALNFHLYGVVPKGFFPQQDTGRMIGGVRGDQSASFQLMKGKIAQFDKILRSDPAVASVQITTGGGGGGGGGQAVIALKPLAERGVTTDEVITRLRPLMNAVPGANMFLASPQDIRVGGRQSDSPFQYTLLGDDVEDLRTWAPQLVEALRTIPQLADVNSDQQERGLETDIQIDRATAARLHLTTAQIDSALQNAFAQRQVSTIYNQFNQYHVIMEVAKEFWQSPETLQDLFVSTFGQISGAQATAPVAGSVKSADGSDASSESEEAARNLAANALANSGRGGASTGSAVSTRVETMVPFPALATFGTGSTPTAINHQGHFAATTISFSLAEGYSLSDATAAIQNMAGQVGMPPTIHGVFAGTAGAFQSSLGTAPLLVLAAMLTVYVVLGILYESYIHPITILSTLPSAGLGAFIALLALHNELGIIGYIGLILLVGIAKKNAIIMVDFALSAQRKGASHRDAIAEACRLRFRPITMTTMAALLGALPLALGFGEGVELRRPLGITIFGGLLVSQILTLYTTPVVYLYLAQASEKTSALRWPTWLHMPWRRLRPGA